MSELPTVRYGGEQPATDWRRANIEDGPDDDEEKPTTPVEVVTILGFDPLDLNHDTAS